MTFFIPSAVAEPAAQQSAAGDFMLMPMMIIFLFLMYFMTIRPQKKRQKEHEALLGQLSKGDEVLLNSGMHGKILKVDDNYVVINTGKSVELKFQRAAVMAMLPKGTIKQIED